MVHVNIYHEEYDCVCIQVQIFFPLSTAPNDFNAVVNAPVRFSPPALTPVCIDIGIVEDVVVENTESFVVQIVQFDSAVVIGNPSMTEISIFDNDGVLLFSYSLFDFYLF